MPSKRKTAIEAELVLPPVPKELIDQFVCKTACKTFQILGLNSVQ